MAKNLLFDLEEYGKEQEVMRGYLESDIPIYLHGLSGDGKSDRVYQLDPTATKIYVRINTPEDINGITVSIPPLMGENGVIRKGHMEDIKPAWLVELEEKCAKEPERLHVLLFDELSNAFPAIQSLVFNIILKHEVNGKWRLPKNARIIAAGNELKDSLAACEIAKPLFSRFAHMYIKTDLEGWLTWACEHDIHPLVIAFQKFTNGEYLRTKYTGMGPNADPRKWEMVSKVLKASNSAAALYTLVDKEVVDKFIKFATYPMVPLQAIVDNDLYDGCIESLDKITKEEEFYLLVANLSRVGVENIKDVYRIITNLDEKYQRLFEKMWYGNKPERKALIDNMRVAAALESQVKAKISKSLG